MQSLPITTDVVSSNLDRARCTTLCDKACQWLARGRWFSPGPPDSSTNKTDCHDITERLLNVVLNTIKQTNITGSFRISALCQWEVFYMFFWMTIRRRHTFFIPQTHVIKSNQTYPYEKHEHTITFYKTCSCALAILFYFVAFLAFQTWLYNVVQPDTCWFCPTN
jgi:hypothetical protein